MPLAGPFSQSSMTVEEILRTDHSRASSHSISFAVKEALALSKKTKEYDPGTFTELVIAVVSVRTHEN